MAIPVANDALDGGAKFAGIQLIFIYLLMTSSLQSNCSQGSFVLGVAGSGVICHQGSAQGSFASGINLSTMVVSDKIVSDIFFLFQTFFSNRTVWHEFSSVKWIDAHLPKSQVQTSMTCIL